MRNRSQLSSSRRSALTGKSDREIQAHIVDYMNIRPIRGPIAARLVWMQSLKNCVERLGVPQAASITRTTTIDISRNANVSTCEELLDELPEAADDGPVVRLASQFGAEFFADVWATILVGTICRRQYDNAKIITWGHREWKPGGHFANSLAGSHRDSAFR